MKRRTGAVRVAQGVLIVLSVLVGIIGVSVLFAPDPFERDAQVLISTFAVGMAIFGLTIILTSLRRGEWWAWLSLWYYPVFFVTHILAFGAVVPDAVFAVLSVAALLVSRPSHALSPSGTIVAAKLRE